MGSGAQRFFVDFIPARYACGLIVHYAPPEGARIVAVSHAATLIGASPDVLFSIEEHGGVHEEQPWP